MTDYDAQLQKSVQRDSWRKTVEFGEISCDNGVIQLRVRAKGWRDWVIEELYGYVTAPLPIKSAPKYWPEIFQDMWRSITFSRLQPLVRVSQFRRSELRSQLWMDKLDLRMTAGTREQIRRIVPYARQRLRAEMKWAKKNGIAHKTITIVGVATNVHWTVDQGVLWAALKAKLLSLSGSLVCVAQLNDLYDVVVRDIVGPDAMRVARGR